MFGRFLGRSLGHVAEVSQRILGGLLAVIGEMFAGERLIRND